eukprot:CAMPEP_0197539000 /NCGR_PEP_ID=MMETSP1318-20131121/61346_1 /TAXON_ID=552666 /ORGANISM="Partenskyella glossopodia, Strain RCC365" /LENGTH=201 /DNA_ID=CAMNT_0043097585 /DNA_START=207 /DNA_END=812 /DNA_ORIENTATION=-
MEKYGVITLTDKIHEKLKSLVSTECVSDLQMLQIIRTLWKRQKYLADPHTAVGVSAALSKIGDIKNSGDNQIPLKVICLATAHPCKFEEAIGVAMGADFWRENVKHNSNLMPKSANKLFCLPEVSRGIFRKNQNWTKRLEELIDGKVPEKKMLNRCNDIENSSICNNFDKTTTYVGVELSNLARLFVAVAFGSLVYLRFRR